MCGRKRSASDCLLKMQTWKLCLEACLETTECVVLNWNKVEAYSVEKEGCPLICRFATMGTVRSIQHSKIGKNPSFLSFLFLQQLLFLSTSSCLPVYRRARCLIKVCPGDVILLISNSGDYLVTIEEKNNATYLRAYTNWRQQVHLIEIHMVLVH